MRRHVLLALAIAGLCSGCARKPGPPSPEYAQARAQYIDLLKVELDDVYGDPRLHDVLALLDQVPATSIDSEAARDLAAKIRSGQAEAAKADESRKKALESATAAAMPPPASAAPGGGQAPSLAPKASAPAAPGPSAGMAIQDFLGKYGSCFSKTSAFQVEGGAQGDAYSLNDDAGCKKQLPGYATKLVLVAGDKVLRLADDSEIVSRSTTTLTTQTRAPAPSAPPPAAAAATPPPPPPPPDYNGQSDLNGDVRELPSP